MKKFYFYHGLLPLLLLLLATLWLDYFHFDFILSDHLYAVQGYNWNLKENWLLEGIIHRGGRIFVGVCITLNLCALITTWFVSSMANYRRGLIYLLTTVLVSLVVVSGLKAITHIDCPWSFQVYGGEKPVHPVFASIFGTGTGRCFPSGHASGGPIPINAPYRNGPHLADLLQDGGQSLGRGVVTIDQQGDRGIVDLFHSRHKVGRMLIRKAAWARPAGGSQRLQGRSSAPAGRCPKCL